MSISSFKNLKTDIASNLNSEIEVEKNQSTSMKLSKSKNTNFTLFAISKNEYIDSVSYDEEVFYLVTYGELEVELDSKKQILKKGDYMLVSSKKSHFLSAISDTKFLMLSII